ncbi:hypothetical protein CCP2SC5_2730002 [Azospirillaceae bacterium]
MTDAQIKGEAHDLLTNYLIKVGLDLETAKLAADHAVEALKPPQTTTKKPRADGGKQAQIIEMLRRLEGATIAQMVEATNWLPHTCRGVLAGALKKRLGLTIVSAKEQGNRVYRLPS